MNILIIDSDSEVIDYTEEIILNTPGIPSPSIQRAPDGQQAADLMMNTAPELLISEVNLAGADGVSLLSSFRQNYAATPIIVMTKELDSQQMAALRGLNVHAILFKPVVPEYIHHAITTALNI